LAEYFGLPMSAIGDLVKAKTDLLSEWHTNHNPDRKQEREGKDSEIKETLLRWFSSVRNRKTMLNGSLLPEKAKQVATAMGQEFKPTDSCLQRWKSRNNIVFKKVHGEKLNTDVTAAEGWLRDLLPQLLEEYEPANFYSCNQTRLFYHCIGMGTLTFKTDTNGPEKKEVTFYSLLMNVDESDKLDLIVTGKSANPRCFKRVWNLPVTYHNNRSYWVQQWDKQLQILDNFSGCPDVPGLCIIKLIFFPNTTSIIQPFNIGVIYSFKRHYVRALDSSEELPTMVCVKQINTLDTIQLMKMVWVCFSSGTITHCFQKAGFAIATAGNQLQTKEEPDEELN
uniref:HTH CENPB-type domain-containing protein n=1 Tax=Latimeria chalumnae TaxID=7897 RepID=H3A8D3_LATCH